MTRPTTRNAAPTPSDAMRLETDAVRAERATRAAGGVALASLVLALFFGCEWLVEASSSKPSAGLASACLATACVLAVIGVSAAVAWRRFGRVSSAARERVIRAAALSPAHRREAAKAAARVAAIVAESLAIMDSGLMPFEPADERY